MRPLVLRGLGSLEKGRLCHISGPQSSGKTRLALRWSHAAQQGGLPVLYIDADHDLQPGCPALSSSAHPLFWLMHPQHPKQAFKAALALCRQRQPSMLVIDSLFALLPQWDERLWWLKTHLPRLIGAAHAGTTYVILTDALVSPMQRPNTELACYSTRSFHLQPNPTLNASPERSPS